MIVVNFVLHTISSTLYLVFPISFHPAALSYSVLATNSRTNALYVLVNVPNLDSHSILAGFLTIFVTIADENIETSPKTDFFS